MYLQKLCAPMLAGLIALSLPGCATPSNGPQIVERVKLVGVPASLLLDCPRADLAAVRTNGELAEAALQNDASIVACNADKAAIRALVPEGNPE